MKSCLCCYALAAAAGGACPQVNLKAVAKPPKQPAAGLTDAAAPSLARRHGPQTDTTHNFKATCELECEMQVGDGPLPGPHLPCLYAPQPARAAVSVAAAPSGCMLNSNTPPPGGAVDGPCCSRRRHMHACNQPPCFEKHTLCNLLTTPQELLSMAREFDLVPTWNSYITSTSILQVRLNCALAYCTFCVLAYLIMCV